MADPFERASRFQALVQSVEAHLVSSLRRAGFLVELEPLGEGEMRIEREGVRYVAQLKVAKEPRRALLEALLADALLRARASARQLAAHKALAVVGARRLSPALCAALRSYARRFGEGDAFGLVDAEGRLELEGAGLESVKGRAPDESAEAARLSAKAPVDLFSDRNQWLLKVLLAPRFHKELLAAPRAPVRSASQLAKLAKVSVPSAARFVSALKSAGHLALRNGALSLMRPAELLQRWSAAVRPTRELPARWILPATNLRRQLAGNLAAYVERLPPPPGEDAPFVVERARVPSRVRACLGLFAAAEQMGFETPRASPMHLYVEEASGAVLERLGLVPARPGEVVHVFVRRARYPESLFRAAVTRGGAPTSDVLQLWMDLADHPARGGELADRLWRERIEPALVERA